MSKNGWYTDKRKAITPAKGLPMPKTPEYYRAMAQRDHDLIMENKERYEAEIIRLKQRINQLEQRRYLKTTANAIPAV